LKNVFHQPSWGHWLVLGKRIAKETRRMLSREDRELCLNLYGKPTASFVNMITSKKVYALLDEVRQYRNNWIGHGGPVDSKEWSNRLMLCDSILSNIQNTIADNFDMCMLLSPEQGFYQNGIFDFEAKILKGSRTVFKKERVKTITPMDKNKLYITHEDQIHPLELLPFLRLHWSPHKERNTCYFYNRLEKDGIRWISYYLVPDSEIITYDNEGVFKALSLLANSFEAE